MDPFSQLILTYTVRATCAAALLASMFTVTVTVSWTSLLAFLSLIASFYLLPARKSTKSKEKSTEESTKKILKNIYESEDETKLEHTYVAALSKFFSYDPEHTTALENFEQIKSQSNCLFARKAKIWSCPEWIDSLSLEENIYRLVPMLIKFTIYAYSHRLDAFLIEIPGSEYGTNIEVFGRALCRVLRTLSDNDPAGQRCMNKSYIAGRGWVFEFNICTFFITTFAPFYPSTHPRFSFGAQNCYILMQPELSFALHDLPSMSLETNWDEPQTVRDKIRCAFRDAGRPTFIPESISSPMILEILTPVEKDGTVPKWWLSANGR